MSLLRNSPFEPTTEYAQLLDDLDFLAPMRGRFIMPQMDDKDAIYFATHKFGLPPVSTQFLYQKHFRLWTNNAVMVNSNWEKELQSQQVYTKQSIGQLLHIHPETLNLDQDCSTLVQLIKYKYPDTHKCYTFVETLPQSFINAFDIQLCEIATEKKSDDGIAGFIAETLPNDVLLYLPSIVPSTGNALSVSSIISAAKAKNIVVVWDISYAINNMIVDLSSVDILFAVFSTHAYLNGGLQPVWGVYSQSGFEISSTTFPLLNAASLIATLDIQERTSQLETNEKIIKLVLYFKLLLETYPTAEFVIVTTDDTLALSGYFVAEVSERVKKNLLAKGIIFTEIANERLAFSFNAFYNTFNEVYQLFTIIKE